MKGLHSWTPENITFHRLKDGELKQTCLPCRRASRQRWERANRWKRQERDRQRGAYKARTPPRIEKGRGFVSS